MRRSEHKKEVINALNEAQKIAFSPLSFQAIASMIELGILKEIDSKAQTQKDLENKLSLSEYVISTLLEVSTNIGIVKSIEDKYEITFLGKAFLYDEMTRVNFNFTKDVCYAGAEKLTESFMTKSPKGFNLMEPEAKTIYPSLSHLPPKMKKSWFEFDHYYSDNCFDIIYKIITPVSKIFDIGANTGKFGKICLKYNPNIDMTLIDLPENINVIKNNHELAGLKFHSADVLSEEQNLPQISGAVLMSQFLDCFSKEQIKFILQKIVKSMDKDTKIYILEPFIDRQKYKGAEFALVHTSLYFTCMANGCSKMYSLKDMEELVKESGLRVNAIYDALGAHDYTLLECIR